MVLANCRAGRGDMTGAQTHGRARSVALAPSPPSPTRTAPQPQPASATTPQPPCCIGRDTARRPVCAIHTRPPENFRAVAPVIPLGAPGRLRVEHPRPSPRVMSAAGATLHSATATLITYQSARPFLARGHDRIGLATPLSFRVAPLGMVWPSHPAPATPCCLARHSGGVTRPAHDGLEDG